MPLLALALILGSSLAWTTLDALRKELVRHLPPAAAASALALGQAPLFALWAAASGSWQVETGWLAPGLGTIALNTAAILLFFSALRTAPLSRTIPLLALTPVCAALVSRVLLGELPAPRPLAGIALVVMGTLALTWREGGPRLERGSVMMATVALLWSITSVLDKRALTYAPVPMHALLQCLGAGSLVALVAARDLPDAAARRAATPTLVRALVVSATALALQFLALKLALVGLLEAVKRGVGVLGAVVLGRLAFGEDVAPRQLVAALVIVAGVALCTL